MTDRKHFKQRVRERMRKTGERYSVARAHLAQDAEPDGWTFTGGVHADTAAFRSALANLGVLAPHTGEPLTEAMLLGAGGGLGAGYILWEFAESGRIVVLDFRHSWQYPGRWAAALADRLGLHAELHETGSARAAHDRLEAVLDRGLPALVTVDAYHLGHRHLPAALDGRGGPPVVVYGRDGEDYLVDARTRAPLTVPADRLAAARARVGSYRHRLIAIDPERVDVDATRLRDAVRAGLAAQVEHLSSSSTSFSLPAWRKWARLLTDTRNAKAWPRVFADGRGVASALASIYAEAAGGGHLRHLYADFLDEAEAVAGVPLHASAGAWRAAGSAWDAVVDTALAPGDELRVLIDATEAAVADGDAGADRARRLAADRWALQAQRDEDSGIPPGLGPALAEVYAAETAALDRLRHDLDM